MDNIITNLLPEIVVLLTSISLLINSIVDQNDKRIREELSFVPKSLKDGIRAHINEARIANNLKPI